MTLNELMQYRGIKEEINLIRSRYDDLTALKSQPLTGMPSGGQVSKPTECSALILAELKERYADRLKELLRREKEILDFIDGISDDVLAFYVKAKYIDFKTNEEIAETLMYDRTTLPKRLKRYLEKNK